MSRVYQSFENSTPFLRGYQELRIPIVDADGAPAWPELFPLEKVEQLRGITIGRFLGADATDSQLRTLEAQRALVHQIEILIERGK
jgi:hypothetical protein